MHKKGTSAHTSREIIAPRSFSHVNSSQPSPGACRSKQLFQKITHDPKRSGVWQSSWSVHCSTPAASSCLPRHRPRCFGSDSGKGSSVTTVRRTPAHEEKKLSLGAFDMLANSPPPSTRLQRVLRNDLTQPIIEQVDVGIKRKTLPAGRSTSSDSLVQLQAVRSKHTTPMTQVTSRVCAQSTGTSGPSVTITRGEVHRAAPAPPHLLTHGME